MSIKEILRGVYQNHKKEIAAVVLFSFSETIPKTLPINFKVNGNERQPHFVNRFFDSPDDDSSLRYYRLGIRVDDSDQMALAADLGAAWVRIAGNRDDYYNNPNVKKALRKAEELGLKVLFTYNPTDIKEGSDDLSSPVSEASVRKQIRDVIAENKSVKAFQSSNEPDNKEHEYMADRSLAKAAVLVKIAGEEIEKTGRDIMNVAPAMEDVENTREFVKELKDRKIDINRIYFDVHAFHETDDIINRTTIVKTETAGGKIICAEVGASGLDRARKLIKLLEIGEKVGCIVSFIHEMSNVRGMGLTLHNSNRPNYWYWTIRNWAREKARTAYRSFLQTVIR